MAKKAIREMERKELRLESVKEGRSNRAQRPIKIRKGWKKGHCGKERKEGSEK